MTVNKVGDPILVKVHNTAGLLFLPGNFFFVDHSDT
jgi:hypothetical protein